MTYLSSEYARQLIVEPIRIEASKDSRYRGVSVVCLLYALIVDSPYYIMHRVPDQWTTRTGPTRGLLTLLKRMWRESRRN